MEYRVDKKGLLDTLGGWNGFLKRKVHLIACGGTAMTLLGVKASTKDIYLMVPDLGEYEYLIGILKQLGYKSASGWGWSRDSGFIFDLFRGKAIHTTELLESPLEKGNHVLIKEFSHIYLGALNYYDVIISKLFRSTAVDIEDCISLVKNKKSEIDLGKLKQRFHETASFDVSESKVNKYLDSFMDILKKEGIYNEKRSPS